MLLIDTVPSIEKVGVIHETQIVGHSPLGVFPALDRVLEALVRFLFMIGSGHAIATQRTELPVAFRCTGLVVDETKRQIVRLRRRVSLTKPRRKAAPSRGE